MPPGIIADINSFSTRQRDRFWGAHAGALICVKACDQAADFMLCASGAVRPPDRGVRPMAILAIPPAISSISTPPNASCSSMEQFCKPPFGTTLEHFLEK
jgi:hypothetical protein